MTSIFNKSAPGARNHNHISVTARPLRNVETRTQAGDPTKVIIEVDIREGEGAASLASIPGITIPCLDVSPSMAGKKLEAAAKPATIEAVTQTGRGYTVEIITFDASARHLGVVHGDDPTSKANMIALISAVTTGSGTAIGSALNLALQRLKSATCPRSVIVISDGQTQDAQECLRLADAFARDEIRIDFLGTEDVDVNLARALTDRTCGRLEYLSALTAEKLADFFGQQMGETQRVTVQNITSVVRTLGNVRILAAAKAYPDVIRGVPSSPCSIPLGNLSRGEHLKLYLELSVPQPRQDQEVPVGEIAVTYDVPQRGFYGKILTIPLVVRFATGVSCLQDSDVLRTMQLVKAHEDMTRASSAATPEAALTLLASAQRRTRIAGDDTKTQIIGNLMTQIKGTSVISDDVRKTAITAGRRTKIG